MSDSYKIDRFNGENWPTWKIQMQAALMDLNIWDVVDGSASSTSTEIKVEDKPKEKESADAATYRTNIRKAYAKIVNAISPKILLSVEHLKHPKLIWDFFVAKYEQKTAINKVYLMMEMFHLKMDETTKPEDHIAHFERIANQMETLKLGVSDELLAIALLVSLPKSYSQVRAAMEVGHMQTAFTSTEVKTAILAEALRRKTENPVEDTTALFAKPNKKPERYCSHCKTKTHSTSRCFKLHPDLAPKREKAAKATTKEPTRQLAIVASSLVASDHKEWFVDSGASSHMTSKLDYIRNYEPFSTPIPVALGDNRTVDAIGKGDVLFDMTFATHKKRILLTDILYVPEMGFNLFSVTTVVAKGCSVEFNGTRFLLKKDGKIVALGTNTTSHTTLNCEVIVEHAKVATISPIELWHQRLGHIGYDRILATAKLVDGVKIDTTTTSENFTCEACIQGKQHRTPLSKEPANRAKVRLIRIHSDICGPMSTQTFGGKRYFAIFVDDYSRLCAVAFLREKSDLLSEFLKFKTEIELQTGEKIKLIRSDNGGEYISSNFSQICAKNGIKQELTAPHTPSQDGVAERKIRTLVELARTILIAAKLPKTFWGEAIYYANWITNRSATKSVEGMTPYEAFYSQKPDLSVIHTFGCKAWVYNHEHQAKFDPKSKNCIYIGPTNNPGTHKLYNPTTKRFFTSRDVKFEEQICYSKTTPKLESTPQQSSDPESDTVEIELLKPIQPTIVDTTDVPDLVEDGDIEPELEIENDNVDIEPDTEDQELRRSNRKSKPVPKFVSYSNFRAFARVATIPTEPTTFKQAMEGPNSQQWKDAAFREFSALQKMETWKLVPLPPGHHTVSSKWVWKVKTKADGSIERYKARLVARGFTQQQGIDYEETFAPVARLSSIRMLLAIAANEKLKIFQMDVDSAYLYGKLDEEIYMSQPEGFVDPKHPNYVCKLLRSLYGLKQAAKVWNQTLHDFLLANEFHQSVADPCIYYYSTGSKRIFLAVYVDDLLIVCATETQRDFVKKLLMAKFNMKDLGEAHYILGIQLERENDGSITLSQSTYLCNALEQFGMSDCKPLSTPTCGGDIAVAKLAQKDEFMADPSLYRQAVGKLNYAAVSTRPDLAFAVSLASRFMASPTNQHWQLIKRIFRYIKATINYGLKIGLNSSFKAPLVGFSDADWAGDTSDRKSTTGYIFYLFGSVVSWNSKKQPTVALSSTEAEYMALAEVTKEAIWIRKFLDSLGYTQTTPTLLMEDNMGAIELAKNPVHHSRTKHIDIRHHFVREKLASNEIELCYIQTGDQIADALTKPLTRDKFDKLCQQMLLLPTNDQLPHYGGVLES